MRILHIVVVKLLMFTDENLAEFRCQRLSHFWIVCFE